MKILPLVAEFSCGQTDGTDWQKFSSRFTQILQKRLKTYLPEKNCGWYSGFLGTISSISLRCILQSLHTGTLRYTPSRTWQPSKYFPAHNSWSHSHHISTWNGLVNLHETESDKSTSVQNKEDTQRRTVSLTLKLILPVERSESFDWFYFLFFQCAWRTSNDTEVFFYCRLVPSFSFLSTPS
jgi:hypothetical protein